MRVLLPSSNALQWISRFSIDVSTDNSNWVSLGQFAANTDQDTPVETIFNKPVTARFVRITVVSFNSHSSMRWDVLTLNPGGRIDDGTNIVQSNSFVKTADLSGSILTALNKNIETLAATDADMKKLLTDAQKAQDAAQTLFKSASDDLAFRKSQMEASATKAAAANDQCTAATSAAQAAASAVTQANSDLATVGAANDKEIAVILQLKDKLAEV